MHPEELMTRPGSTIRAMEEKSLQPELLLFCQVLEYDKYDAGMEACCTKSTYSASLWFVVATLIADDPQAADEWVVSIVWPLSSQRKMGQVISFKEIMQASRDPLVEENCTVDVWWLQFNFLDFKYSTYAE